MLASLARSPNEKTVIRMLACRTSTITCCSVTFVSQRKDTAIW